MVSIQPEYLDLSSLLSRKLFRIPTYQRFYSWGKRQRTDLFEDIKLLKRKNKAGKDHFMAMVACLKTGEEMILTEKHIYYDVVDGQQRLTTRIILLKALSKSLAQGNKNDKSIAKKINENLVKKGSQLVLLQTNFDNSSIFRNYLLKGTIPDKSKVNTAADRNLYDAFIDCETFVSNWQDEYPLTDLLTILNNRLTFVLYTLEDEGAVYTVFEVLNNSWS